MYDLILHNGVPVISSRDIAERLEKRHSDILAQIDGILENGDFRSLIFEDEYSVRGQARRYKQYLLTKDGFILYMFNIQGHNDFKLAYIQKFNEMEEIIKNGNNTSLHKEIESLKENVHLLVESLNKTVRLINENIDKFEIEKEFNTNSIEEFYTTKEICKQYGYSPQQTHKALLRRGVLVKTKQGYAITPKYYGIGKMVCINGRFYIRWNKKGKESLAKLFTHKH